MLKHDFTALFGPPERMVFRSQCFDAGASTQACAVCGRSIVSKVFKVEPHTGLSFSGGAGISVSSSNDVQISNGVIQNSSSSGLFVFDHSAVDISNMTIQGCPNAAVILVDSTLSFDGGVVITNNRFGVYVNRGHFVLNGGDGTPGTANVISNNQGQGVNLSENSTGEAAADNQITGNLGNVAVFVWANSTLVMSNGTISNNPNAFGVFCMGSSHCDLYGTAVDGNGKDGVYITDHSDLALDGGVDISSNARVGLRVEFGSMLDSAGGNTINNNADDGIVLDTLSVIKFAAPDTAIGNGKLALECNNGSMVSGDVTGYKPRKCGSGFQANPIN